MGLRAALAAAVLASVAVAGPGTARAERRAVAVLDLDATGDLKAVAEQNRVLDALNDNPRLRPVSEPEKAGPLRGVLIDEDTQSLADARGKLASARDDLRRYDIGAIVDHAEGGLTLLATVGPSAATTQLYAELFFARGIGRLGRGQPKEAAADFLLVHRLEPGKKLDDDLLPEIVTAYEHAKEPAARATLDVHGTGRAWIDGVEIGDAPAQFPVAAGPHLVQLAGVDREPRGTAVVAAPGDTLAVDVPDAPIGLDKRIHRARAAIAAAGATPARGAAIARLAALVNVKDVVLFDVITEGPSKRVVEQTWQEQFGLSAVHGPEEPQQVLDDLAPPLVEPPPVGQGSGNGSGNGSAGEPAHPVGPIGPIGPPSEPLYLRRWFQGTVGGVILTAIVVGIVASTREGTFSPGNGTLTLSKTNW